MKATIDWDKSIISSAQQDNFWNPKDVTTMVFESREQAVMAKKMMAGASFYAPYIPQTRGKSFASCIVNCKDSIDTLKAGLDIVDRGKSGLGIMIDTPGGHADSIQTIRAAIDANIDGNISIVMPKSRGPIHSKMDGIMNYALKNITFDSIECTQLFPDVVKDIQTPPTGRSQKQHNLIQAMNKKGRY